jgi:hypothetical protein
MFDIDSDGDLDWIAGNSKIISALNHDIYKNDGAGTFTYSDFGFDSQDLTHLSAGDLNNDGTVDLIVGQNAVGVLYAYTNAGTGIFTERSYSTAAILYLMLLDVDNDGDLDVVLNSASKAVWINDGHGNLTEANSSLPATLLNVDAADFNSDGYLDLVITGGSALIYKNSGTGAFIPIGTLATGISSPGMAVGDIDGDGDIDVVIAKSDKAVPYFNNGAGTSWTAGTDFGAIAAFALVKDISLGDLDNDGDLDVIMGALDGGNTNGGNETYLNDGAGAFTQTGTPTEEDDWTYAVAIGDIDADGDLDYIAANQAHSQFTGAANRVYKSDQAATLANTAPTASTTFAATLDSAGATANVRLTWGSGSDTITATRLLQYQLKVGTGTTTNNILSSRTSSPNWVTRVMPNGQSKTMLLKGLTCGKTYYWSVATVDTGFKSTNSCESTFTLDGSCALTESSCGSGGSSGSTGGSTGGDTGGGIPARFFDRSGGATRSKPPGEDTPEDIKTGSLIITAYGDLDGNTKKSSREQSGFKGLPVNISGKTSDNQDFTKDAFIGDDGMLSIELPPSDKKGFLVAFNPQGAPPALPGAKPAAPAAPLPEFADFESTHGSPRAIIKLRKTTNITLGLRRSSLLRYNPCLTIGEPLPKEKTGSEGLVLMQRLQDNFKFRVMKDIDLQGSLVLRKHFFLLLQRTQCVSLLTNQYQLQQKVKPVAKKFNIILPLIDLPISINIPHAVLAYSLFSYGADVSRQTSIGYAADFDSPISRFEAIRSLYTILNVPYAKQVRTIDPLALPKDLPPTHPIVPAYLTLRKLGILPDSFFTVLGGNQGVTPEEFYTLMSRAAFRGGKIELLPPVALKSAAAKLTPTFLAELPPLEPRACLERNTTRPSDIIFSDILPGTLLFSDTRELLSIGTKNSANVLLWLLTGTKRVTEFGITKGQTNLSPSGAVTTLEAIRALLVVSCLPPQTKIDVMSGKRPPSEGSAESRIAKDRISNLARNGTLASRVFYRAQDHQMRFDLSLFTYAEDFLRGKTRSQNDPLTIKDASAILASTTLRLAVDAEVLTPLEAEEKVQALSAAIARDLLGAKKLNWRDEAILKSTLFTRGMLIQYLATIVLNRTSLSSVPPPENPTRGNVWWTRVR